MFPVTRRKFPRDIINDTTLAAAIPSDRRRVCLRLRYCPLLLVDSRKRNLVVVNLTHGNNARVG